MRKFLVIVLTVLILVLTFFFIRDGLEIGNLRVLGVYEIQALSGVLDQKISEATDLTQTKYKAEEDNLNSALKEVANQRERYETVLAQSSSEDIAEALTKEKYEVEKLWISIGNYADEHKVQVNMQITNSSSGIAEVKDLNFTINGSYTGITEFIYDLEDDAELEFKIENFNMVPDKAKSNIKATFTVKDVNVNISTVKTGTSVVNAQETNTTGNTVNNTTGNTVNQ